MLQTFLGGWLYWPIVVLVISFTITVVINNISLWYTELREQRRELRRLAKSRESSDGQHAG